MVKPKQSRQVTSASEVTGSEKSKLKADSPPHAPLLELRDVTKTYLIGEISVPVLRGVSCNIYNGEYVALMGASGSGKTTLMNIIGCLDRPTSGQIVFRGFDTTTMDMNSLASLRCEAIGFIFQNFNLLPRTSALDNVLMPLSYAPDSDALAGKRRAKSLLTRLGLGNRIDHEPSQLSGGQQQRVAIARALINSPALLLADEPTGNLDTATSKEVLAILRQLNEDEGLTVIIVTHDEMVARQANRIIHISDGVITYGNEPSDLDATHSSTITKSAEPHYIAQTIVAPRTTPLLRSLVRQSGTALLALRRNILRATLTALGIIIGVASVIVMMEIGQGSAASIAQSISSMGANNLLIMPGTAASGGVSFGAGSVTTLTPDDGDAILRESPSVKSVAPVVRARTQVVYGNRNWVPIAINGTTPSFLTVRDWDVAEGAVFTERDVRNANKVCLIGQSLVRELFGVESPLGKEIRVQNVSFTVIGVLARKGANMMGVDQDDILIAPWTSIKYRVTGNSSVNSSSSTSSSSSEPDIAFLKKLYPNEGDKLFPERTAQQIANNPLPIRFTNVDQLIVSARSSDEIQPAIKQITTLLRARHRLQEQEPDDFNIRDMTEMTKVLSKTSGLMTKLLLAVALISLVVGGVGIMNIMLVSVTERTREIGLRLAIGARRGQILQQFLIEAVLLCVLGGLHGILLGRGLSLIVAYFLAWPTVISIPAIATAFSISVAIGIIFGFFPAWKASRYDPIVALRYE